MQKGLISYVEERAGAEVAELVRQNAGPGGEHPLFRTHPETGRLGVYYADGFADGIIGLNAAENEAFRPYLASLPADPSRQCRWRWSRGTSSSGTSGRPSTSVPPTTPVAFVRCAG